MRLYLARQRRLDGERSIHPHGHHTQPTSTERNERERERERERENSTHVSLENAVAERVGRGGEGGLATELND